MNQATCRAYEAPVPGGAGNSSAQYALDLPGQIKVVKNGLLFPYMKSEQLLMCPADKPNLPRFYEHRMQMSSYTNYR